MSEVEVDYWENQRYKPLQGWSVPYQGGIAPYSDITGKSIFQIESVTNDSVFIPSGWEWSPDSSWAVDLSGKFGQSDSEGWSYGLTFEGLTENSKLKRLKSERSTSNVVRRRRWFRSRICVSTEANAIISLKTIWGNIVREKIAEVVEKNEVNYMRLTEYNSKQKKVIESILLAADLNLNEVNSTLDLLNEKLQSMKSFLIERGQIESQYGKKLESLASKWMTAGMPKKAVTSRLSFSGEAAAPDKGQSGASNSGFFYVVSAANQSIAERLNEYSNLLCDGLPKDVGRIVDEVADALLECRREGQELRAQIASKSKTAAQSYEVYSRCQESSQNHMMAESDAVQNSLLLCSATNGDHSMQITPVEEKESCFLHLQTVDVWLAMQLYNTDLIDLDSTMLQYNAFCKQQQKKAASIGGKVGELLQSTVKVFAYEQFRVWQDSASMLDAVASGGSRTSNNNPMRGEESSSVNSVVSSSVAVSAVSSNVNPLRRKSVNTLSSVSEDSTPYTSAVVANNVNPLRRTPSKSSTDSLSNSNLSSGSGDSAVFVNPMMKSKSTAITPVKEPQQQYPSSNFEEAEEDDMTSGFGIDDDEPLTDNEDDGNRDATLKLPSHCHLRLSNSKALLVKVGVMKVLILRSGGAANCATPGGARTSSGDLSALVAGGGGISGLSTAHNKTSAIGAIDYDQFVSVVVMLTFNRVLHLMHYTEEVATAVEMEVSGASPGDFASSSGLEGVTNSGSAVATSLSSAIDATTERLLANDNICFDKHKLLLSINLAAGCHVGPVFIPKDGYRDSFEVRIPPQPRSLSTSLSSMMGATSATVHKTDTKGISSVLFTTDDSIKVRNWMRSMSNPFVDPNIDSPQDFDCEDNEYIVMGTNLDKGGRADTTEV